MTPTAPNGKRPFRIDGSALVVGGIALLGMIVAWSQFQQHMADFEATVRAEFERVHQDIGQMEIRERENTERLIRLDTKVELLLEPAESQE